MKSNAKSRHEVEAQCAALDAEERDLEQAIANVGSGLRAAWAEGWSKEQLSTEMARVAKATKPMRDRIRAIQIERTRARTGER